jgi:putative membrane protein
MRLRSPHPRESVLHAARGVLMGAADVVPGVSGGTMALIVGIYMPLVATIRTGASALGHAVRLQWGPARTALRAIDWWFIGPLFAGIVAAVLTLARVVEYVLDHYPEETSAFFFGLVLGSVPIAWAYLRRPAPMHLALAGVTGVVTFVILGYRGSAVEDPRLLAVFLAGAVAICAMILPGISGSLILLMLGLYDRIIEALNDRELGIILSFAAGAVIGLALFSTLLDYLLRRYHDLVMAVLTGLLIGSLRVLWPWPEGAESAAIDPPSGAWPLALALALGGTVLVLVIGRVGARLAAATERRGV